MVIVKPQHFICISLVNSASLFSRLFAILLRNFSLALFRLVTKNSIGKPSGARIHILPLLIATAMERIPLRNSTFISPNSSSRKYLTTILYLTSSPHNNLLRNASAKLCPFRCTTFTIYGALLMVTALPSGKIVALPSRLN